MTTSISLCKRSLSSQKRLHTPFFLSLVNAAFLLHGIFLIVDVGHYCARSAAWRSGAWLARSGNRQRNLVFWGERNRKHSRRCLVAPLAVKTDMDSLKTSTFTEYRRPGRPLKKNAERCGCKLSIERTGMKTPLQMRESAALISYQARKCPVFIKEILSLLKVYGQNHSFHLP